jgi:two-component system sensor histidine kinase HydH
LATRLPQRENELDLTVKIKNEPRRIAATLSPLLNANSNCIGAALIFRDITQLRRLEGQIRRDESLVALGRFAAGVAHEIRNPLSSIRGLAQFLAAKHKDDSGDVESFRIIDEEVARLNRKLTELLCFARHEPPAHDQVDATAVLRRVATLIEPDVQAANIRFEKNIPSEKISVLGNSDRLQQAFLNVLLNAIEAAGEGGVVSLSASACNG